MSNREDIELGKKYFKQLLNRLVSYNKISLEDAEKIFALWGDKNDKNYLALGLGLRLNLEDKTLSEAKINRAFTEIAKNSPQGHIPSLNAINNIVVKNAQKLDFADIANLVKINLKDFHSISKFIAYAGLSTIFIYFFLALIGIPALKYFLWRQRN